MAAIGLLAAALIVSTGTAWAFLRGGQDFNVFYFAWKLVLSGHGQEIYHNSPDRFLYAPGFAWLFSPIALLPRGFGLALWCFLKAAALGWMIREFAILLLGRVNVSREAQLTMAGFCAWALVLVARPILIDFQYGQVNLLILGICTWALCRYLDPARRSRALDGLSWGLVGIAAVGKLYPVAVGLVPFFVITEAGSKRRSASIAGLLIGSALVLLIPLASEGLSGTWALYPMWRTAILDKGLPLESHNQSFIAFLYHYCSGVPTEVIAQARRQFMLGFPILSRDQITLLGAAWAAAIFGILLGWIIQGVRAQSTMSVFRFVAVILAMLILPSHLVWKPYFVFGFPIAVLALWNATQTRRASLWIVIGLAFVFGNLTGFDFVGGEWAAHLEAASVLLWAHLGLLAAASARGESTMSAKSP